MTIRISKEISNYDYHNKYSSAYVSWSQLKDLLISKHYFYQRHIKKSIPAPDTTEMRAGSYFHALCTSENLSEFIFSGAATSTSKEYKELKKDNPDKIILTTKDQEDGVYLYTNLLDAGFWKQPVFRGNPEESIKYKEVTILIDEGPITPVPIRIRPDMILNNGSLIDFKSTSENPLDAMSMYYTIFRYMYHGQLAFYSKFYTKATGQEIKNHYLVFSSKKYPECAIYKLDPYLIKMGNELVHTALEIYSSTFGHSHKEYIRDQIKDFVVSPTGATEESLL